MNAMIFNGSVRNQGRTAAVTSCLKEALIGRGSDVKEYFLYSLGIKGCLTCGCGPGKDCAMDLVDKLLNEDVVIFASPIRMQRTTDSLNAFIEMLFHLCRYDDASMEKANGRKAAVVLATSEGLDSADESLQLFREFFARIGMNFVGSLVVPFEGNEPLIEQRYKDAIQKFAEKICG